MCSLEGNASIARGPAKRSPRCDGEVGMFPEGERASIAGGERSAAPGAREDLFLNGTVGIWMLDCSLRGNASTAKGQRSAAPGAREDLFPNWTVFGYSKRGGAVCVAGHKRRESTKAKELFGESRSEPLGALKSAK